ncbi:MAG: asparagine synthase (glutamine-hydrolyzing) [Pseudomonadota bacterium]
MCGIAGMLAGSAGGIDADAVRRMTAALAARGPDGEGFFFSPLVALGHRRLAVIDVEGGKQPICSEDGQVVVVVNGELYNYRSLTAELKQRGHCFATLSDSEVLVHGYEEWGDAVLDRLEGMFAIALWDGARRRLLLARDRLGEKPLYWAMTPGGGLAFASELKALKHCPGIDTRIDPGALARYLVYEYIPAPATILKGVRKLEPGTKLIIGAASGKPTLVSYWDLPLDGTCAAANDRGRAETIAAESLLGELRRSVTERLVADVPLGVFLSGGIDSSAVAALAAQARGGDLDTFSIGFGDPSYDETAEAQRVALAIGSRHHQEHLSPGTVLELIPAVGELLDEPLGDSSIVPTYLLARFARRHVTVAVGGDGGDELFAGYPTFVAEQAAVPLFDWIPPRIGRTIAAAGRRAAAALLPVSTSYFSFDFKLKQFLKGIPYRGPRRHQAWLASLLPQEALAVLAPDVGQAAHADLFDVVDRRMASCTSTDRWDRLLYFYAKGYLADDVLMKVDRATMAVGLEARAPFLDSRVVSLACRLAPALRLRGLETKRVLRRALRGVLPAETLARKKQGFAMPIGRWLREDLAPLVAAELGMDRLCQDGLFDPPAVRRLVDDHLAGRVDNRKPLWTIIAFQLWLRAWRAS